MADMKKSVLTLAKIQKEPLIVMLSNFANVILIYRSMEWVN